MTETSGAPTPTLSERSRPLLEIEVWTDFACPFCYLAKPRLDAAIAATGRGEVIALRYRAWELFADATDEPFDSFAHVVDKFAGHEDRARELEGRLEQLAHAQGQPYLVHHPVASSADAHRMLKLAAEDGLADAFLDRLQRDLFGGGVDVYHADYLIPTAIALGIPAARAAEVLNGTEYAADVREDQARGRAVGLTGIPFTVLDGRQAIAGLAGTEDLRRTILAALDVAERDWAAAEQPAGGRSASVR